jgi:hypothetical protein
MALFHLPSAILEGMCSSGNLNREWPLAEPKQLATSRQAMQLQLECKQETMRREHEA